MVPSKGPSGQGMRIDKFFQPVAAAPSVKPMDVSDAAHSSAKRPLGASGAAGSSKRLAKVAEVDSPMLGHATPSLHTEAVAKRPISASEGAGPSSANAVGAASRAVGAAIAASSERRESPLAPGGAASSSKLVPVAPGPVPGPATAMARCPLPDQLLSEQSREVLEQLVLAQLTPGAAGLAQLKQQASAAQRLVTERRNAGQEGLEGREGQEGPPRTVGLLLVAERSVEARRPLPAEEATRCTPEWAAAPVATATTTAATTTTSAATTVAAATATIASTAAVEAHAEATKPAPLTAGDSVAEAEAEGLKLEPNNKAASGFKGVSAKRGGSGAYYAYVLRTGKQ
eukprot:scaffold22642_cov57-Phaeocystis_antarctica.AAC.6